ncbi:hypothetical protein [Herbaspirillum huttiense]|uniref:hypothetical protein n=1 Tax=Herbaspirillum huttiense TaxID=863372 RepID=UPI0039AF548C
MTTDVKTRTSSVRKIVQASVFFFEFMWLHDTLHLTSVTPSLTNELKNLLLGGWPNALRLGERLLAAPRDQVRIPMKITTNSDPKPPVLPFQNSRRFRSVIDAMTQGLQMVHHRMSGWRMGHPVQR